MRVLLLIVALVAFIVKSEAQNSTQWNATAPVDTPVINRPGWNLPRFNRSQWDFGFNRTQQNPSVNRTQLLGQILNQNQNKTSWKNQFFDRTNNQAKNRTNGRHQLLNNTLANITSKNSSRRNGTIFYRPKRSDRTWVVPVSNQTADLNRSQWDVPAFNRTQLLDQILNQNQNKTSWKNQFFDRTNNQAKNRTNGRHQLLNNTLANTSRWNGTIFRPRRSDPKWVAPVSNHTWNQTTHNGDVIVGQIGYLDRLLFNQTYRKESRWWSGREKSVEYPHDLGKYGVNRQETITAIRIYNKFLDGLHSSAKISSGGVGYRYVKIKLSSPWNKGFEYLVQIFGR